MKKLLKEDYSLVDWLLKPETRAPIDPTQVVVPEQFSQLAVETLLGFKVFLEGNGGGWSHWRRLYEET